MGVPYTFRSRQRQIAPRARAQRFARETLSASINQSARRLTITPHGRLEPGFDWRSRKSLQFHLRPRANRVGWRATKEHGVMLNKIVRIGLCAMLTLLAPVPALAVAGQLTAAASAASIPNRATVRSGTHRTRAHHRNTLNRQKARATAEHARRIQAAPNR